MTKHTRKIIEFLKVADKLKAVKRRVHTAAGRPENSAEHSWHLALAVWLLKDELGFRFDVSRALEIALVHDLVEIYAGDTYFFDVAGRNDKDGRERRALARLVRQLPSHLSKELQQLWHGYETKHSLEARVVKALDQISPIIQILITSGGQWRKSKLTHERLTSAKRAVWPSFGRRRDVLWKLTEDLLAEAKTKKLLG